MWESPPAEPRHGFLSCNRLLGSFKMYACPQVFRAVPPLLELIALPFFFFFFGGESHKCFRAAALPRPLSLCRPVQKL
jgi:hypothetical protein